MFLQSNCDYRLVNAEQIKYIRIEEKNDTKEGLDPDYAVMAHMVTGEKICMDFSHSHEDMVDSLKLYVKEMELHLEEVLQEVHVVIDRGQIDNYPQESGFWSRQEGK